MAIGSRWAFWTAALLVGVFSISPDRVAGQQEAGWDLLQQGGFVVLIRHAKAPGFGDPPNFRIGDCATQRNLSEEGRRQARSLGESFRRRNIPIEKVYSSQWCRCKDTAELAFGEFQEHPALNSFFEQPELKTAQTETLIAFLQSQRPHRGNLILVTHQVNITALTEIVPAQGEMTIARLGKEGQIKVEARLILSE